MYFIFSSVIFVLCIPQLISTTKKYRKNIYLPFKSNQRARQQQQMEGVINWQKYYPGVQKCGVMYYPWVKERQRTHKIHITASVILLYLNKIFKYSHYSTLKTTKCSHVPHTLNSSIRADQTTRMMMMMMGEGVSVMAMATYCL